MAKPSLMIALGMTKKGGAKAPPDSDAEMETAEDDGDCSDEQVAAAGELRAALKGDDDHILALALKNALKEY